ncbi:D-galactonate dehydratase, partial [Salmonella enterica subsp. enterica serovar Minnesota]
PILASAVAGLDQALWDIRGKVLGMPVYKLLGGPVDARGVRGYYHARARNKEELVALRSTAIEQGVSCFKSGIPGYYEWIETHQKIDRAVR